MTRTVSQDGKPERKKSKTFIVLIRPEFKTICANDACRAGMFNHILYNVARAKQQGSEYWHSTGDDIWEETQRSWGKSKTLKEIKDLVSIGLVAQCANPKNSWDRTKYYTFGEEQAKKLHDLCVKNKICMASIKFPSAVSHLLNLTNAFCKNNKCICCNQQIDLLDSTDRFVKSNIPTGFEEASEAPLEDHKDSTQDSTQDSFFSEDENPSCSQTPLPTNDEKKEVAVLLAAQQRIAELEQQVANLTSSQAESARLQENKAHQSTLSQQTVAMTQAPLLAETVKPAKPKLPDMCADMYQRNPNQPLTDKEQKRIDDRERREHTQQIKKRTEELWLVFDRLFRSRVDRYGYNKPHIEELALNALATDEIIEKAFNAVANGEAVKKDPTRLNITNIAIAVPSFIRVEQIKVVQANQPKEETALEKIKRERQEVLLREAQKEIAQ